MSQFVEFLQAIKALAPEGSRVLLNQFPGDPQSEKAEKWRVRALGNLDFIEPNQNVYITLSAFKPLEGAWKRRNELFVAALALVIDDLGTKAPLDLIDLLPPTMLVETSPGNYQAAYLFDAPVTQIGIFNELVDAFVLKHFGGVDPGMKGATRVWRPGVGINGKEKHKKDGKPFVVRVADLDLTRRYTVAALVKAFDLQLRPPARPKIPHTTNGQIAERIEHFLRIVEMLKEQGLMVRGADNRLETWIDSGWVHITCPWIGYHTDRSDTGAAIRGPAPRGVNESGQAIGNDWNGAFRCHHGHCEGKGWAELTDYVIDCAAEHMNGEK